MNILSKWNIFIIIEELFSFFYRLRLTWIRSKNFVKLLPIDESYGDTFCLYLKNQTFSWVKTFGIDDGIWNWIKRLKWNTQLLSLWLIYFEEKQLCNSRCNHTHNQRIYLTFIKSSGIEKKYRKYLTSTSYNLPQLLGKLLQTIIVILCFWWQSGKCN